MTLEEREFPMSAKSKRSQRKQQPKSLELKRESRLHELSATETVKLESDCKEYLAFLSAAKTERLAYVEAERLALAAGYVHWDGSKSAEKLKPGDKIMMGCRGKTILLAHIGKEPL